MSTLRRNFVLLTASNLLAPLFSIVLVLAISRVQGVQVLGKYSLIMTVFVLGQSCAALGLPVVITREVSRLRQDAGRYLVHACAVGLALVGLILLVALAGLQWGVTDVELRTALSFVVLALLPTILCLNGEAVLLAFEHARSVVEVNLAENVVRAGIGTIVVLSGGGVAELGLTILIVRLLAGAAFVIVLHRHGVVLPARLERKLCGELLRYIPVLGSIPIVNAIYARADVLLLTWLGTWTEVGLYSAAMRLVDAARTVAPAYARALYPILSRLRAAPEAEFIQVAQGSIRTVLFLSVPMAILLSGLAPYLISLLYGPAFAQAAASLGILAWSLIPMALAITLAQMLFSADKQALDLRVNVIATVASVLASAMMIPRWGAVGASAAVLTSTSLYAALQYVWVRQHVVDPAALGQLGKILFVAATSAYIMLGLRDVHPLLAGLVGLGTYGVGLTVTRLITLHDWNRLRLSVASTALRGTRQ